MDITVAVCARNAEKHIADCLESINNQTVKPAHVFVIDDHSTDATAEIARRLGARVLVNEGRQLYDGRNTALRHCRTEVLAFTDADCVLDRKWVENILRIFATHDVAGGTGRHPPVGASGFAGWLHHMWFLVETNSTGYTGGVIGGNCYFKTDVLRKVGGWISLAYSNAEDIYISEKLKNAGYKLWFDEEIIVYHKYTNSFRSLMKKAVKSGEAITVMMKVADIRTEGIDFLWWFTLMIPVVAIMGIIFIISLFFSRTISFIIIGLIFGSILFLSMRSKKYMKWLRFKNISDAIPRFAARSILIWPYSWGILKGLIKQNVRSSDAHFKCKM